MIGVITSVAAAILESGYCYGQQMWEKYSTPCMIHKYGLLSSATRPRYAVCLQYVEGVSHYFTVAETTQTFTNADIRPKNNAFDNV